MCSYVVLLVYVLLGLFALFALGSVISSEIRSRKMNEFYKKETKRFNDELLKLAKKNEKN